MPCRRQPTWRAAPHVAQGDAEQNAWHAASRRFAVRRPAGVVRGCLSTAAPLAPQFCPVFQALPDLALEAALRWIVELPAAELLREVVLPRECLFGIVVVFVA